MLIRVALVAVVAATAMAGARAWASRPQVAPTAQTGASFSLEVGAQRSAAAAAQLKTRLEEAGVAAYSRSLTGAREQVMAGPYVSLDEAEAMQRRLRARGFGSAPLFVDDTLRRAPRNETLAESPGNPALVLVGAPGRVSLAAEMRSEPRQVTAHRVDATTLHVDIGPIEGAIDQQAWNAPAGAHLIRGVAVEPFISNGGLTYARARLVVPAFARANTRIEGRRVYIDLTWPEEKPAAAPRAAHSHPRPTAHPQPAEPAPRVDLDQIAERVERVMPFVESAAQAPSADVVAALRPMVDELAASLRQVTVTPGNAARHAQLTGQVQRAAVVLGQ